MTTSHQPSTNSHPLIDEMRAEVERRVRITLEPPPGDANPLDWAIYQASVLATLAVFPELQKP